MDKPQWKWSGLDQHYYLDCGERIYYVSKTGEKWQWSMEYFPEREHALRGAAMAEVEAYEKKMKEGK